MRRAAEKARRLILQVPNVQKVELLGVQEEKVYVEIENAKLASLGIPPTAISSAIKSQNIISPSAMVETETDNVYLRITGTFDDLEAIKETPVAANGKIFRLGDIATVERRTAEPMNSKMYYNGEPAIGIAVSMEPGGNVLELGDNLDELIKKISDSEPVGLEIHQVSDQPKVVEESIDEFVSTLREAVIIVLIVSFLSLGILPVNVPCYSDVASRFLGCLRHIVGGYGAYDMTEDLRKELPLGYSITPAGSLEDSDTAMDFLLTPVPVTVFIVVTLLMIQLRRVKLVILTLLTAPMGVIGVTFGMLLFDKALGFVAYLGILALMGMIIRNSVVLIDQIEKHLEEGETPWDAVVDSAIKRFRPIMLTAATTILGMLPLMTSAFWGPMATAIACGLVIATALTLLVRPTMYAAFYRIKEE